MTEKVILDSDKSCTVTASGETTKVRFEGSYRYIQVRHMSGEIICGRKPGIADGEDGTSKLTSGGICFDVASPVIYIGGNGVCEVYATNSEMLVFKDAPASGGGGNTIINDNILSSTDTTWSAKKISDEIIRNRGITLYRFATLTKESNTVTRDVDADTIILAEIYNGTTANENTGYYKICDMWMRINTVADGKYNQVSSTSGISTSHRFTLKYVPSTHTLSVTSSTTGAFTAILYEVEIVKRGLMI